MKSGCPYRVYKSGVLNVDCREGGYALAYKNGVYGFVDASYIDW